MLKFNDIIGQDSIKEHLLSAMKENKISHAYIFAGDDGLGKLMTAERFAAALQCTGEGEKPCGSCISCMQSESHNHPDTIYVTHEKSIISVSDIRNQIIGDISIKPYSGNYKIYIIDEAEKMNEAAQNALLKTLEEPPEYAVIILLATNTGAFLQTILSRCITLQFKPVETELIIKYLMEKVEIPDYHASLCASFASGSIGRAIKYSSDDTFKEVKDEVLHLVKYIDDMNQAEISDTLASFAAAKEKKIPFSDYLDLISLWFHDVLVFKATKDIERVLFKDELSDIKKQAELRSFENLNDISNAIETAKQHLNANVLTDVVFENLLFTVKQH